jgi:hypothetical protein
MVPDSGFVAEVRRLRESYAKLRPSPPDGQLLFESKALPWQTPFRSPRTS